MLLNLLLTLGQWERERISESWGVAREKAISRGVFVAAKPPVGYIAGDDGRLIADPVTAPTVREAFELRAAGASIAEVGHLLDTANERVFTHASTAYLLGNRTYLGEVRHGDFQKAGAHEPLVTLALFEAANSRKPVAAIRRDSKGEGALLSGLIRCAGCSRAMAVSNVKRHKGSDKLTMTYRCKVVHASGRCQAPATVLTGTVDSYVTGFMMGREIEKVNLFDPNTLSVTEDDLAALEAAVADAESRVTAYVTVMNPTDPAFRDGYDANIVALNAASADLANGIKMAQDRGQFDWPTLTMDERRRILRSKMQAVFVKQGQRMKVEDRCHIVWQSDPVVELPRRGVTTPLLPVSW
jgi:hypothetical protein